MTVRSRAIRDNMAFLSQFSMQYNKLADNKKLSD